MELAREMRHKSFIPWILESGGWSESQGYSEDVVLQRITLQFSVRGRAGWQAWYEENSSLPRTSYLDAYFARLLSKCRTEPSRAQAELRSAMYRMDGDWQVSKYLDDLSRYPDLRNELCVLIKFAYRPHIRQELEEVANAVLGNEVTPEDWAVECLADVGLRPGARRDWMQDLPIATGP
jgi:hypothetical protein